MNMNLLTLAVRPEGQNRKESGQRSSADKNETINATGAMDTGIQEGPALLRLDLDIQVLMKSIFFNFFLYL